MTFGNELWLILLFLVPWYAWRRWRNLGRAPLIFAPLQFGSRPNKRRLLFGCHLLGECLLLMAVVVVLAGPQRVDQVDLISEPGLDLALCLDISASMQADDFAPSRLESLKLHALELVDGSPSNRIAVYAFAGHVFTQTPLTSDHRALEKMVSSLNFESINHAESGGTALGDALIMAAEGLLRQRIEGRDQAILLITDGESNVGADPHLAARYLVDEELRLVVLGIGGDDPVPVSVRGEPFITSEDKQLVTSLDDEQLMKIAADAGGVYYRARSQDALDRILTYLAQLERTPLEIETIEIPTSFRPQLARLIGILFVGWLLVEATIVRRPLR